MREGHREGNIRTSSTYPKAGVRVQGASTREHYPGAAGARELAHRAPGAIILGGGCEFVLEFLKTHLEA